MLYEVSGGKKKEKYFPYKYRYMYKKYSRDLFFFFCLRRSLLPRVFRSLHRPLPQVDEAPAVTGQGDWMDAIKKCGNGESFNSQLKKKSPLLGTAVESTFASRFFPFQSQSTPGEIPKSGFAHPCASATGSSRVTPGSPQPVATGGKKGNIGNVRIREA